ncbi:MAG TPA: hypothetical protein VG944_02135 [Fimbriimonas sp.]|nr:hypothetical protein [Fimbriimonas sp.]
MLGLWTPPPIPPQAASAEKAQHAYNEMRSLLDKATTLTLTISRLNGNAWDHDSLYTYGRPHKLNVSGYGFSHTTDGRRTRGMGLDGEFNNEYHPGDCYAPLGFESFGDSPSRAKCLGNVFRQKVGGKEVLALLLKVSGGLSILYLDPVSHLPCGQCPFHPFGQSPVDIYTDVKLDIPVDSSLFRVCSPAPTRKIVAETRRAMAASPEIWCKFSEIRPPYVPDTRGAAVRLSDVVAKWPWPQMLNGSRSRGREEAIAEPVIYDSVECYRISKSSNGGKTVVFVYISGDDFLPEGFSVSAGGRERKIRIYYRDNVGHPFRGLLRTNAKEYCWACFV